MKNRPSLLAQKNHAYHRTLMLLETLKFALWFNGSLAGRRSVQDALCLPEGYACARAPCCVAGCRFWL